MEQRIGAVTGGARLMGGEKQLDLIVANDVTKAGIAFGSDNNEVVIIDSSGRTKEVPILDKDKVAYIILDSVKRLIKKKRKVVEEDWY